MNDAKLVSLGQKLVWPMRGTGAKIGALIETRRRWRQFLLAGKGPARHSLNVRSLGARRISLKGKVSVVRDEAFRQPRVWVDGAARAGAGFGPAVAAKDQQRDGEGGPGPGTVVITRPKTQIRHPNMYRVLLLNDDYTPMEFVVSVLRKFFNKGPEDATRIMLHVHQHGVGECGVFTYEIAETKVTQVMDHARKHQHPLQCIMEKK
jgi:ATP-dependent Clp protease adaptor protein ClpS